MNIAHTASNRYRGFLMGGVFIILGYDLGLCIMKFLHYDISSFGSCESVAH